MLLPICLGIFLVGILIPNAFGDHEKFYSDTSEIEEHAMIAKLPSGVKFPAPNFTDSGAYHSWDFFSYVAWKKGNVVMTYHSVDFPQQGYGWSWGDFSFEKIKLVEGNEQDLLVFDLRVEHESDSPYIVNQASLKIYDGKDRWFTPITSTISKPLTSDTSNPAFGWNETCHYYTQTTQFQPGIKAKMEFCFEIPKDSDHFKAVYAGYLPSDMNEINSGLAFIVDRAGIDTFSAKSFAVVEPTVKPPEPTSTPAEFPYIIIALLAIGVVIGGIIVAILVAKKGSKPPTTVARTTWKHTTVLFCDSCGTQYKTDAKFCGGCGAPRS